MYNHEIKLVDATGLGITKKCRACKKVRKITRIEPKNWVVHPVTGDVFVNEATHYCEPCAYEYEKCMEELSEYNELSDNEEFFDISAAFIADELGYMPEFCGPTPPAFAVM